MPGTWVKDVAERSGLETEPHCTSASPWNNPCVEGRIQSVTATSIEGYVVV